MRVCPSWLLAILAIFGIHHLTPIAGEHLRLRQAIEQLHDELTGKKK